MSFDVLMGYSREKLTPRQGDARAVMNCAQVSRLFRSLVESRRHARLLVRPFVILAKRGARWKRQEPAERFLNWNIYVAGDHCEIR